MEFLFVSSFFVHLEELKRRKKQKLHLASEKITSGAFLENPFFYVRFQFSREKICSVANHVLFWSGKTVFLGESWKKFQRMELFLEIISFCKYEDKTARIGWIKLRG